MLHLHIIESRQGRIYTYIYICIYTYISHIYIYICIYTYIHVYMHRHIIYLFIIASKAASKASKSLPERFRAAPILKRKKS